jgi:hypothetical protein
MSDSNKFTRWLTMVVAAVVMAFLVWRFSPSNLLPLSIGAAIIAAIILGILVLRAPAAKRQATALPTTAENAQPDELAADPGLDAQDYKNAQERISDGSSYREIKPRLPAGEVVARYAQMAAQAKAAEEASVWKPTPRATAVQTEAPAAAQATVQASEKESKAEVVVKNEKAAGTGEASPLPLIVDQSSLTEDDKTQLENAVWYRCENPFCKYTHFLEVHHITDEKDGGNNKLENLIVLCPYCHELAHKGEIPEKEMRDWIAKRDERFNTKLDWHY